MKAFRDPVHNLITFDKKEESFVLDLIDTKEFQRLRYLRQLGFSSFTYPGAEHSRFCHSLGVTHLGKRVLGRINDLRKNENIKEYCENVLDNRNLLLAAALLHDIGHGPFSHAFEKITGLNHEKWTAEIIKGDTEVNQILENVRTGFSGEVAAVIQRTNSHCIPVVKLLSSQLDCDRMDYMLRDSLMTGAGYGRFDLEWMLNVLTLGKVNDEVEVGLDYGKGLGIAEDFVLARFYMYQHVYMHKTTRCAELLLNKIFERANELLHNGDNIYMDDDLKNILTKKEITDETIFNYLNLTENTIWHCISRWQHSEDEILKYLCKALLQRKFYKLIPMDDKDMLDFTSKLLNISRQIGVHPKYLYFQDRQPTLLYKDPSYRKKNEENELLEASEQIFLFDKAGKDHELSKVSKIINGDDTQQFYFERYYVRNDLVERLR